MPKKSRPYGLWDSPLSPDSMASARRLNEVVWADDGDCLVWVEGRGSEGVVVAQRGADAPRDVSEGVNVRGGVGYGGGELAVHRDIAFFCGRDGRLYRARLDKGQPRAITPAHGKIASPAVSPDGRWVAFVWSDGNTDLLAVVDSEGRQWPQKIVVGADFYMQPAWSSDGSRLTWIAWDHPNMPWDGTRLETAEVTVGKRGVSLGPVEVWAGGDDVAVQQPRFSPDGRHLAYTSDASGFSHVYLRELTSGDTFRLSRGNGDFAGPAWVQGLRSFDWSADGTQLVAVRNHRGRQELLRYSVDGTEARVEAAAAYTSIRQPAISPKGDVAFIGSSSAIADRVVALSAAEKPRVYARSSNERVPPEQLSEMEPVSWRIRSGSEEIEVFANFYPPVSTRFESSGRPPAIVMVHGGPTSQRVAGWEARNQFFATRGFAVLDVNYRGSTGYGRDYMDALKSNWGVADVEDVVSGARFLIDADLADPDRLVVMGGSAGGYTVLQVLTNHPGAFAAGVCLYGIANLFTLQMGTHKFEASYNDSLVGPLPEAAQAYRERSPIFRAEQIRDAVAVYHGREDKVVPIDQAEAIVKSLRARGVPHVFHVYENEGHGWRRPENIEHFYRSLMDFLKENVLFS